MPTACKVYLVFLLLGVIAAVKANKYWVDIRSTGAAVIGSTINFTATLYERNVLADSGTYSFKWSDNLSPPHVAAIDSKQPFTTWSVEYTNDNKTMPGKYTVSVDIKQNYLIWISVAANQSDFLVTDSLNGKLTLSQNGENVRNEFVATNTPINHTIIFDDSDFRYIEEKATYVQTYWFTNCTYVGMTDGMNYTALYSKENEFYEVEALVVASFEKMPDPTTTTTTTTTTSTTTTSTTTTTTTTPKPTTTTSSTTPLTTTTTSTTTTTPKPTSGIRRKRESKPIAAAAIAQQSQHISNATRNITVAVLGSKPNATAQLHTQSFSNPDPPFICANETIIDRDPKKAYGFFRRRINTKAPVSNFTVNGKNWLLHGDLLNLEIKCKGSASLEYCTLVFNAPYNATGNETCHRYYSINECQFNYMRYFSDSKTVLFFIRNQVSDIMNQVTINIYEVKKQSQLSVVVVPISFTLVAIILVVFGVSYYIQSRNRFNVEVADFNFGETQSVDMEYKTFQQRLIDSMYEVMPRRGRFAQSNSDLGPEPDSPGGGGIDSNLRYNTMG